MKPKNQPKTKKCKCCKSVYIPQRSTSKYCSDECRNSFNNNKRSIATQRKLAKRKLKVPQTAFFLWIISECKRAGTVEILKDLTSDDLKELLTLRKRCNIACGMTEGKLNKAYELSHIAPSKGFNFVGKLSATNLVIAPVSYNRKRGNNYSSGGEYIYHHHLRSEFLAAKDASTTQVIRKIEKLLGGELEDFLLENTLNKTQKNTLIHKLVKIRRLQLVEAEEYNNLSANLAAYEKFLNALDVDHLQTFVAEFGFNINKHSFDGKSELQVLKDEIARFGKLDSVHGMIVDCIYMSNIDMNIPHDRELDDDYQRRIPQAQLKVWGNKSGVIKDCWDLLHGERCVINDNSIYSLFTMPESVVMGYVPQWDIDKLLCARNGIPLEHPESPYDALNGASSGWPCLTWKDALELNTEPSRAIHHVEEEVTEEGEEFIPSPPVIFTSEELSWLPF